MVSMTMGFSFSALHQLDDSGLCSIAAANAGADDAGVAAVTLCIAGSNLLEQLLADVLTGDEAQSLTIGCQIALLAESDHLLGHGLDLLATGDGGLHSKMYP